MADEILSFWFPSSGFQRFWFSGGQIDRVIKERFEHLLPDALSWSESDMHIHLSKIIVLDQFSRHLYRNQSRPEEYDVEALASSLRFLDSVSERTYEPNTAYLIFGLMPLRHARTRETLKTLVDFCDNPVCPIDDAKLLTRFQKQNQRALAETKKKD